MAERGPGLIGGLAAGRPMLCSGVIAFAAAALTSVAYRDASIAFTETSVSFIAALFLVAAAPAATGAAAPRNFWLRMIFAGISAGLILAGRRLLLQTDATFGPFDANLALACASAAVFSLAAGAPLWRSAIAFAGVGLLSQLIAASAGLSIVALETARLGPIPSSGAALAFACGAGAALCVQIAAAFSREFAEGADNFDAAAKAAKGAAAPAIFAIVVGGAALALCAFEADQDGPGVLAAGWIAAAAAAFHAACAICFLAGALALKAETERTAVDENRRRAALRPLLAAVRNLLPPSSAIAFSAIFLIIAVVAAFEANVSASAGEIALITVVAVAAALSFVSLGTALMAALFTAAAARIAVWGVELSGFSPPSETARIVATGLAAVLTAGLFLAWRDRRNPRRKTREVVRMALADSLFAYAAAATLAVCAVAASDIAGLWSEGVEAALFAGLMTAIGFIASPPLMTAVGALFGRD